jgi:hypothetical protein
VGDAAAGRLRLGKQTLCLWGASIRPSRSELVLVEQPTEPIASVDIAGRRSGGEEPSKHRVKE